MQQRFEKLLPQVKRNLLAQPAKRLPRSGDENETERYSAYCDDDALKNRQPPVTLLARNEKFNVDPLCNKVMGTDLEEPCQEKQKSPTICKDNTYSKNQSSRISGQTVKLGQYATAYSRKFLVLEPLQAALWTANKAIKNRHHKIIKENIVSPTPQSQGLYPIWLILCLAFTSGFIISSVEFSTDGY